MNKRRIISLLLIAVMLMLCGTGFIFAGDKAASDLVKLKPNNYGDRAYEHVYYLSETLGKRAAGTEVEVAAAAYVTEQFEKLGLDPIEQEFTYSRSSVTYDSQNIIAVRPAKNSVPNPKTLIVVAHYDSTGKSLGAHDNASGIAVLLEAAERLQNTPLDYEVIFLAVGAEEEGLKGSFYYAGQMTEEEIANTFAVINLDSLIAGDYLYVHGNGGEKGWLRDQIIGRADKLDLNLRIQPGLNPDYPAGVGYPASDHVPFEEIGIPYVNYESTNWEEDQLDKDKTGYVETTQAGVIWHSVRDNLTFLESTFPGRVKERLADSTKSLTDIFTNMQIPDYEQPNKKIKVK